MDPELPDDFAAGVLRRTTGSACITAEPLLPALVDGETSDSDRALLEQHVARCASCGALVGALGALRADLPALAEVEPDAAFVGEVLAATVDGPSAEATPARSWRDWLPGLVARPRFSFEAAFLATMVLLLVFGSPAPRALFDRPDALAHEIRAGAGEPLDLARRVWDRAGPPIVDSLTDSGRAVARAARALGLASSTRGSRSPQPSGGADTDPASHGETR